MVIRLLVCILPVGLNKAAPVHLHKRYDSSYERHCWGVNRGRHWVFGCARMLYADGLILLTLMSPVLCKLNRLAVYTLNKLLIVNTEVEHFNFAGENDHLCSQRFIQVSGHVCLQDLEHGSFCYSCIIPFLASAYRVCRFHCAWTRFARQTAHYFVAC